MPRGRHYFGPGFWKGGPGPAPWAGGWWGGNPAPFCRFFPWLPRHWWAYPGWGFDAGWLPGYWGAEQDWKENEAAVLKQQAAFLEKQLEEINRRLGELGEQK
ncbi:hypothetical protein Tph_c22560 [Thermacetogenium phaeum DSM 12270]|uniref:DUF5320 domain-containing protein n=1 Tax=Thermacetogenium phaeum (strain ATCC BAA-254 / DSM 26808 / PB) TaxID=1089553 RepID=K4LHG8_THEPS|nr:DUF5320 domain-containing protein [Thermacetogenium phaeum]AFV12446.1 hypothetical protein Tph_c22560 [Thermacetogenium phaeum DSM 12270]